MRASPSTPGRRPLALAGVLLALCLLGGLLAGCGDDEEGTGGATVTGTTSPDGVTGTTSPDGGTGTTVPELPDNDDPSAVQCTGPPEGTFDATAIVGEPLRAAMRAAEAEGCSVREVIRDGEPLAVTQDFRPDRVNVATEGGTVTEIIDLG